MDASESDTDAAASSSAASFPVVEWGYDRHLVDYRVAELVRQVAEERRRGDEAEQAVSELRPDINAGRAQGAADVGLDVDVAEVRQRAGVVAARALAEAGRRIEAMIVAGGLKAAHRLKLATEQASAHEQQARQILAEAELERARIAAAASIAAERVRARADREARAVVAKAQEDAELAWQDAARQRRLLEAQAEALATLRGRMVEQLGQLYAPLGLVVVDFADLAPGQVRGLLIEADDRSWLS
jgi:hypothetical protein